MTPSESAPPTRRQLPIGLQAFRALRESGCYYVDKTSLIRNLVEGGRYYFLSRPRRFGKSLLVDTLQELFEGRQDLFRGLAIHDYWDWSIQHPVVRLSFGGQYHDPREIEGDIIEQLESVERHYDLAPAQASNTAPRRLRNILDRLHHQTDREVVVLVDEYDKPILDVIEQPEQAERALANRDYLRGFYGIIKDSARHVRFVLVTGVSRFSKVSLFSGLNNLEDISLNPEYATICGYTETDLDTVFAPELAGLDRDEIRRWYNGYHWLGEEKLYNPFDVLLLFRSRKFKPHWFETGSPAFLYRLLLERGVSPMELERRVADEALVSTFDVGDIGVDALLFQTGYLTIVGEEQRGLRTRYRLDYPNLEVRQSLNQGLLEHVTRRGSWAGDQGEKLVQRLAERDFEGFAAQLQSYLAGVPYAWHDHGGLSRYEAWYASLVYMGFRTIEVDLRVEAMSSHGRADLVVLQSGQVFVLEFKVVREVGEGSVDKTLDRAMVQMRERGYGEPYRDRGEPIHLVAIVFGGAERNLLGIRVDTL